MKIVYFGFDLFADCFKTIADMENVEIMALYTFPTDNIFEFNKEVIKIAEEKGIPYFTEKITREKLEEYFNNGCYTTFSAGYIHKIPILDREDFKGINLHPALLPMGRGPWPYPQTILKGLEESGVTIHKITDRFDEGDILIQKEFPINADETLDTLTKKSQELGKELCIKVFSDFDNLWNRAKPQEIGEYWPEPTDKERTIRENMDIEEAQKIIRAFGSFGVVFKGEVYKYPKISIIDGKIELKNSKKVP